MQEHILLRSESRVAVVKHGVRFSLDHAWPVSFGAEEVCTARGPLSDALGAIGVWRFHCRPQNVQIPGALLCF